MISEYIILNGTIDGLMKKIDTEENQYILIYRGNVSFIPNVYSWNLAYMTNCNPNGAQEFKLEYYDAEMRKVMVKDT